ncbi:MAG: hypothetical protein AAFY57_01490 [Cyanobacteria bacterium J06642_2]
MNFQHLENTLSSLLESHDIEEILGVLHAYASDRVLHNEAHLDTSNADRWTRCVRALDQACDDLYEGLGDRFYLIY